MRRRRISKEKRKKKSTSKSKNKEKKEGIGGGGIKVRREGAVIKKKAAKRETKVKQISHQVENYYEIALHRNADSRKKKGYEYETKK